MSLLCFLLIVSDRFFNPYMSESMFDLYKENKAMISVFTQLSEAQVNK